MPQLVELAKMLRQARHVRRGGAALQVAAALRRLLWKVRRQPLRQRLGTALLACMGMPCLRIGFSVQKLPASKFQELDQQLAGQQAGLNALTVQEYLAARARFNPSRRDRGVARRARSELRTQLQQLRERELLAQGVAADAARRQAVAETAARMRSLHALHNPDLVAGGHDVIAAFGDGEVNSTIGRQWNHPRPGLPSRVEALDQAARQVPEQARGEVHMNGLLLRDD